MNRLEFLWNQLVILSVGLWYGPDYVNNMRMRALVASLASRDMHIVHSSTGQKVTIK